MANRNFRVFERMNWAGYTQDVILRFRPSDGIVSLHGGE